MMNWKTYFDFLSEDDIRIKGTRVGIETVLDDYLNASSPEEIAARYRTLTLEQVYATITYYLQNQEEIDAYLKQYREYTETAWREQQRNPPEFVMELHERMQQQRAKMLAENGPDYQIGR
ncbi:MAG: DUF433 domain-containing protein [Chloroflexota bacterium]|nr:DUF433 domain-containing protein [Chloroflexota bacterium]